MGTNYYIATMARCGKCGEECGHELDRRHIGKSSMGWCFALRVYPEDGINSLDDWRPLIERAAVFDEYGGAVTPEVMLQTITQRGTGRSREKTPFMYSSWADFHNKNHSTDGPNGLVRARVDGRHCIGHGDGTYDYIAGEFS